jgi:cell division protein FtsL
MRAEEATAFRRPGPSARARHAPTARRPGRRSRLRVGRPPRTRRKPRLGRVPFAVLTLLVVGSLLVGVVTLQAIMSQTSFRMRELERQSVDLRQQYGQLKLEVAKLSAPGRIVHEAKRLGLRLPEQVRTISVESPTPISGQPNLGSDPAFALKGVLGEEP